jgi:hypothetical protein
MRQIRGWVLAGICACLSAACDSTTDPRAVVVHSIVLGEAVGPTQAVRIELEEPAAITLDYQAQQNSERLRIESPRAKTHDVLFTRLRPNTDYEFEVAGTTAKGTFKSPPLPEDLARVTLIATGTATVPLVLLHLHDPAGFMGYAIADASGQIVWYWRGEDFPFGAARRANGNFVFMDRRRGAVEVAVDGTVVHELPQDLVRGELHHDLIATPQNTVLMIAFDDRMVDGARIHGESILEWVPETGALTKRWSSWDHLSITSDRGPRFGSEWMHANSLALGPRGNVLMSAHYFNQILSLSPDFQQIEWRLGGVNATVAVPAAETFSGQHTVREVAPNRVVLFDNGIDRNGPSRAVEFEITGSTAQKRWEWIAPNNNFSAAVSSARRLPNGHTLVGFGMSAGVSGSTGPIEVYEVSANGQTLWRLSVANTVTMFRAEPLTSVGKETVRTGQN